MSSDTNEKIVQIKWAMGFPSFMSTARRGNGAKELQVELIGFLLTLSMFEPVLRQAANEIFDSL